MKQSRDQANILFPSNKLASVKSLLGNLAKLHAEINV